MRFHHRRHERFTADVEAIWQGYCCHRITKHEGDTQDHQANVHISTPSLPLHPSRVLAANQDQRLASVIARFGVGPRTAARLLVMPWLGDILYARSSTEPCTGVGADFVFPSLAGRGTSLVWQIPPSLHDESVTIIILRASFHPPFPRLLAGAAYLIQHRPTSLAFVDRTCS